MKNSPFYRLETPLIEPSEITGIRNLTKDSLDLPWAFSGKEICQICNWFLQFLEYFGLLFEWKDSRLSWVAYYCQDQEERKSPCP